MPSNPNHGSYLHTNPIRLTLLLLTGLILVLIGSASTAAAQGPTRRYVDADVTGGANNGTSWTDAYRYLQDALDEANVNGSTAYEIWVAEGVYYPDEDMNGGHTAGSENEYFTLRYNNVQLYGGFADNETSRDQRNWTANLTILSGDIDGNDTNSDGNNIAETAANIQGDNADHIFYLDGESNEIIDSATVIDGFIITAGQADGSNFLINNAGGGLYCSGVDINSGCSPSLVNLSFSGNSAVLGGGMYDNGGHSGISSPSLVNVTFSGNSASNIGGGIVNDGRDSGTSNPSLVNVNFNNNSAQGSAGGMYNYGATSGTSSPTLINVTFSGNSAVQGTGGGMANFGRDSGISNPILINVIFRNNSTTYRGGGLYNSGYTGTSSPTLINVSFSGNSVTFFGGGMANEGDTGISSPTLINVSFSGNSAGYSGGGIYSSQASSGISSPNLMNVILWGNTATSAGSQVYNASAVPTFTNSLVQGGISGLGIDGGGNLDQDPLFVSAAAGDLRLQNGSPAIDAGSTAALPADTFDLDGDNDITEPIPFDLAGAARSQGSAVDIGAYEGGYGETNTTPTITEGNSIDVTMSVNGSPTPFNLTLHATDAETDTLSWSISSQAGHGIAAASGTGNSKAIAYTPVADYTGADNFVVQVSDGALTDTITVNVTISDEAAPNTAPVITEGDSTDVTMSMNGSPTPFNLTLNATDAETDTLSWSVSSQAGHGIAAASGTGSTKAISYSPTTDYAGLDSFVAQVSDGVLTDTITVNVTITEATAPTITEGESIDVTMSMNGSPTPFSLTLSATDAEADTLSWSISSQASHGIAVASGTGNTKAIDYTPTIGYTGPDSFVVQVSDSILTDTITVNVTISVDAEETQVRLYLPWIVR